MSLNDAENQSPFELFNDWFMQAKEQDPEYYNGMTIATISEQTTPDCRVVLLKEFDESGFVFYTNYQSRKGQELAMNPAICANFWWSQFQRQVRIEGTVEKVSEEQSDQYFYSRPEGSQLAAIASSQSQPIDSFDALEERYQLIAKQHKSAPIKRPSHWGGYKITPVRIEFWQGLQHRLHHRLVFHWQNNAWHTQVLQP